jgi:hypothetical protein
LGLSGTVFAVAQGTGVGERIDVNLQDVEMTFLRAFAFLAVAVSFGSSFASSAEIVTDEAVRLQILRNEFPKATISAARNGKKPPNPPLDPELQPLWDSMHDALEHASEYQVVGPVEKDEEQSATDITKFKGRRFSGIRRVRLLLYRLRSPNGDQSDLLAVLNYSFPEANPARCCRAIGRLLLMSLSGDQVLSKVDEMPNAFTMFTAVRFLDAKSTGSERLLIGADFAGAGTVGTNTAVFDLSNRKLTPLGWTTTAVYFGLEKKDEEMFTMTLDEQRTRLSKENRVWFVKTTYIEKGKRFPKPIISSASIRLNSKGVRLDWL